MAYTLHFQPSEVWEMEVRDLSFWNDCLERVNKLTKGGRDDE